VQVVELEQTSQSVGQLSQTAPSEFLRYLVLQAVQCVVSEQISQLVGQASQTFPFNTYAILQVSTHEPD
jgi:hypothetical protein